VPLAYLEPSPLDIHLDIALAHAESRLMPCGVARAERAVLYCLDVLSSRPLSRPVFGGYAAILSEIPDDLLVTAVRGALSVTTYHKLPPPGVFVKAVEPEWSRRKRQVQILRFHRSRLDFLARAKRRINRPSAT
jgi:hypothetical protein